MKLLLLTPQLPYPPRQGAAMRNYSILRYLSADAEISLLSFSEQPVDRTAVEHLSTLCRSVNVVPMPVRGKIDRIRTMALSALPDLVTRLPSAEFRAALSRLLAEDTYDVVQAEGLELAGYLMPYLACKDYGLPRFVLDEHNAEYLLQKRSYETSGLRQPVGAVYSLLQWRKLRLYEATTLRLFDAVTAVSREDAAALQTLNVHRNVSVVPNGVDIGYFRRGLADGAVVKPTGPMVVFTGSMDFRPNVDAVIWFSRGVWAEIRKARSDAQFFVVGRNPLPAVVRLNGMDGVTVTGSVPDVRPYLEAADVFVVPMRMGGGVRLKVLEAMAMGLPIVSTRMGMSGVNYVPGEHAMVADEPVAFAKAVLAMLGDKGLRERLGRSGRTLATSRYDWSSIIPGFWDVYNRLIGEEVAV